MAKNPTKSSPTKPKIKSQVVVGAKAVVVGNLRCNGTLLERLYHCNHVTNISQDGIVTCAGTGGIVFGVSRGEKIGITVLKINPYEEEKGK